MSMFNESPKVHVPHNPDGSYTERRLNSETGKREESKITNETYKKPKTLENMELSNFKQDITNRVTDIYEKSIDMDPLKMEQNWIEIGRTTTTADPYIQCWKLYIIVRENGIFAKDWKKEIQCMYCKNPSKKDMSKIYDIMDKIEEKLLDLDLADM